MIILQRRDVPTSDFPDMTLAQLESEWRQAKECFDRGLVQKTDTDRIYVAAATKLNTLDRLLKKIERRDAVATREAAKTLALFRPA
jgi:hypothetical protein